MAAPQRPWIWFIALLSVAVVSQNVGACSCVVPPPPREAAAEADHVFVGTVVTINEERDPGDGWLVRQVKQLFGWDIDYGYWHYVVEFQISTLIKGEPADRMVVRTNTTSPACGYSFGEAGGYLVYADLFEGQAYTSTCSRTTPAEGAEDEIQELLSDGDQPVTNRI